VAVGVGASPLTRRQDLCPDMGEPVTVAKEARTINDHPNQ
jgi:hypothetical protein